ncbi:COX15/CtaA family protein [Amnibacterium kyonggiense]|uniref:Cytochrome c oxidase assembly protein subunit 15 n=1 Tax=Amnibacterium kyonggiense TaxID=595671 RepID=A0A4R7FLS9_9MICO|nr:COX15/CtaA family protein [Amnibacterium kyonggiense]TDS77375.1 cytochrome c oxidase assembly protein subunit 15 [Amnibacterium kyonggiense]
MSAPGTDRPRPRTPFAWLADRVALGPRALRWGTTAALVVSILIIVTGGVVRITGSGLGCPTWPQCEAGSLTTTPALGVHGVIEFGNRALTSVLIVAVGWAIIAAALQRRWQRTLARLTWSEFWLVVINAVAGGITVLVKLNPYVVALHFVLAIALLTTTTLAWHRSRQSAAAKPVSATAGRTSWALTGVAALLVVLGTIVTGAGPHSGDSAEVHRIGVSWTAVTVVHGASALVVIALAAVLLVQLRREGAVLAARRVAVLLAVLAAQAVIGIVQALTGLPGAFVVLHLLGAALVWVGVLRVLLDTHPALFGRVVPVHETEVREPVAAPGR